MSDEEWACLEPFVIERGTRSGRRPRDHRLVLDGVFWIARTGVAWRDLHEHFGKWSSVYRQFRRWTLSGLWELLLEAFNDSGGGKRIIQLARHGGQSLLPMTMPTSILRSPMNGKEQMRTYAQYRISRLPINLGFTEAYEPMRSDVRGTPSPPRCVRKWCCR